MTRFIHDQFSKDYLEELLKPFGTVQAPSRVAGEVREIDLLFSPFTEVNPNLQTLGLLGKFASTLAIFEPYRNPVSKEEICDCLLKLLEVRGDVQRKANREETKPSDAELPKLWILTPTASNSIISGFNATIKENDSPGIYYLGEHLRTAIVVIHQLPRTPETLWLRVLGRGKVQKQAIDELEQLSVNHPFRRVALELLYNLQRNLRFTENPESEDREIIMRLAPLYQQDREQAKLEGEQKLIIRQLNRRFGEIEEELINRVKKLSAEQLEVLGEDLFDFVEVADLVAWLVKHEELKN
ncbi:MAG TPA: DUF4351 domain-containing protein [Nostocaceae cyanobacterium]|nr:DUF4351 domain-containing protein [Nostocaceae cyanobacterium]